jgi:hypothetical protein
MSIIPLTTDFVASNAFRTSKDSTTLDCSILDEPEKTDNTTKNLLKVVQNFDYVFITIESAHEYRLRKILEFVARNEEEKSKNYELETKWWQEVLTKFEFDKFEMNIITNEAEEFFKEISNDPPMDKTTIAKTARFFMGRLVVFTYMLTKVTNEKLAEIIGIPVETLKGYLFMENNFRKAITDNDVKCVLESYKENRKEHTKLLQRYYEKTSAIRKI